MNNNYLVVVDMQVDFVDGVLGTPEAVKMIPQAIQTIQSFQGTTVFTQDTHQRDYLSTLEGKKLPVLHCVEGTPGWEFHPRIKPLTKGKLIFKKETFGSTALATYLKEQHQQKPIDAIYLLGLCTDICVISNAMTIKAFLPNTPIHVIENACAGVTPSSHHNALEAMKVCHINVMHSLTAK